MMKTEYLTGHEILKLFPEASQPDLKNFRNKHKKSWHFGKLNEATEGKMEYNVKKFETFIRKGNTYGK